MPPCFGIYKWCMHAHHYKWVDEGRYSNGGHTHRSISFFRSAHRLHEKKRLQYMPNKDQQRTGNLRMQPVIQPADHRVDQDQSGSKHLYGLRNRKLRAFHDLDFAGCKQSHWEIGKAFYHTDLVVVRCFEGRGEI
ncbi:hypothetical protein AB205_0105170 [Aquarana catesbeiana]|uniref:Uncharacterized protein n=1 Tax=Aquarana catesbeiana TaxID=8400 RepID=A0A2G9Q8V2_AQUCT|nr:hypothetical protein AB205_0105170 [Aquarana catesbeiana]